MQKCVGKRVLKIAKNCINADVKVSVKVGMHSRDPKSKIVQHSSYKYFFGYSMVWILNGLLIHVARVDFQMKKTN